jgi:hypothetical protein
VPPRSGRRSPAWFQRGLCRQRHKIENFFQRIKIDKRVSTRYEKLALTFLNFVLLSAIFDWLKSSGKDALGGNYFNVGRAQVLRAKKSKLTMRSLIG